MCRSSSGLRCPDSQSGGVAIRHEVADDTPERLRETGLAVAEVARQTKFPDEVLGTPQVGPRHGGEQRCQLDRRQEERHVQSDEQRFCSRRPVASAEEMLGPRHVRADAPHELPTATRAAQPTGGSEALVGRRLGPFGRRAPSRRQGRWREGIAERLVTRTWPGGKDRMVTVGTGTNRQLPSRY